MTAQGATPRKLVLFESYSIVRTLLAARLVRAADAIYFYVGVEALAYGHIPTGWRRLHRRVVERLAGLLSRRAEVRQVPQDVINRRVWMANKDIVDVVGALGPAIERTGAYGLALGCIGDAHLIRYYQHRLAESLPPKLLFWRTGVDLSDGFEVTPVPGSGHGLGAGAVPTELSSRVPLGVRVVNAVAARLRAVASSLLLIGFPALYLGREVLRRGITLRKPDPVRARVLQTIIWGVERDVFNAGIRFDADDTYLVHEGLPAGDIAYTFRPGARYAGQARADAKAQMEEQGFSWVDPLEMKVTPALLRRAAAWQVRVLLSAWSLLTKPADAAIATISYGALYQALQKTKEMEYVECEVEFCLDDLDPAHVVKNIVSSQHGRKTVGVQHRATAGPFLAPQLCFVHYDVFCAASRAHVRLHAPWWDGLRLEKPGSMWIDRTVNLAKDAAHLAEVEGMLDSLYGKRAYRALIAFPNRSPLNMSARWDEMYQAVEGFASAGLDCTLFLRFRNLLDARVERFGRLAEADERIVIDHVNVTTYDLMALCDAYITSSHSSGMIEAVAIGKPSFTFDYRGTAGFCYGGYGKDLILRTKEDVRAVFEGIETGFAGFDCDWDALREDFNYHYDGDCLGRLRRIVVETLDEVEAAAARPGRPQ